MEDIDLLERIDAAILATEACGFLETSQALIDFRKQLSAEPNALEADPQSFSVVPEKLPLPISIKT